MYVDEFPLLIYLELTGGGGGQRHPEFPWIVYVSFSVGWHSRNGSERRSPATRCVGEYQLNARESIPVCRLAVSLAATGQDRK